MMIDNTPCILQ